METRVMTESNPSKGISKRRGTTDDEEQNRSSYIKRYANGLCFDSIAPHTYITNPTATISMISCSSFLIPGIQIASLICHSFLSVGKRINSGGSWILWWLTLSVSILILICISSIVEATTNCNRFPIILHYILVFTIFRFKFAYRNQEPNHSISAKVYLIEFICTLAK